MVMGPQILKVDLWKQSGHFDHYRENMYFTEVDEQIYGIKPMNCLSHMLIYKSKIRSYRDLPLALFRTGHGSPPRENGRAARPDAGAPVHPG